MSYYTSIISWPKRKNNTSRSNTTTKDKKTEIRRKLIMTFSFPTPIKKLNNPHIYT